ncbi:MAG: cytochrome c oxidase subunit 3 [Cellvibrionales bacterium]|nr:cytochrome c oxidase subunit 3 [Cellvibrionales bacterium]
MASEGTYYVPEQSRFPIIVGLALGLSAYGAGQMMIDGNATALILGMAVFWVTLACWWNTVISEHMQGLTDTQLKRSYVWGIGWFIFSEVMFFAAFFGALFYVRTVALPTLGGWGMGAENPEAWGGFEAEWPLMTTPDQSLNGEEAAMLGPKKEFGAFPGWAQLYHWLPLWGTIILMSSSWTVHLAHHHIKHGDRRALFNFWLGLTVLLGATFLGLQAYEYYEAYAHYGLTLQSGIYGTTFFMLTGFHGFHVAMGTIMLAIQLARSLKGHFRQDDHFGFEMASWYWHFVDVVWVMLFFFVYIL